MGGDPTPKDPGRSGTRGRRDAGVPVGEGLRSRCALTTLRQEVNPGRPPQTSRDQGHCRRPPPRPPLSFQAPVSRLLLSQSLRSRGGSGPRTPNLDPPPDSRPDHHHRTALCRRLPNLRGGGEEPVGASQPGQGWWGSEVLPAGSVRQRVSARGPGRQLQPRERQGSGGERFAGM